MSVIQHAPVPKATGGAVAAPTAKVFVPPAPRQPILTVVNMLQPPPRAQGQRLQAVLNYAHTMSAMPLPAFGRVLGGGSQQAQPGGGIAANPDEPRAEAS